MSKLLTPPRLKHQSLHLNVRKLQPLLLARYQSNNAFAAKESIPLFPSSSGSENAKPTTTPQSSPLSRLPTPSILRTLLLGTIFNQPLLFRPSLAILKYLASRPSTSLLSPDTNPLLRAVVKPLIYNQFCAGVDRAEIEATSARIKGLGFSGVVLCYGRETRAGDGVGAGGHVEGIVNGEAVVLDGEIEGWEKGNLETLEMTGEGDWLGIK